MNYKVKSTALMEMSISANDRDEAIEKFFEIIENYMTHELNWEFEVEQEDENAN